MKYEIEKEKVKEFFELIDNLESLLTDRISDLHQVKGGVQARHCYIMYRDLAWKVKFLMEDNLKEVKTPKK